MASVLSTRRPRSDITLEAQDAGRSDQTPSVETSVSPPLGWLLLALIGGLVTSAASWILSSGISVLGWLADEPGSLTDALRVGTRIWLLGNGVPAQIGQLPVTIVPLGATAISAFMLSRVAALAARRLSDDYVAGPAVVAVLATATYVAPVLGAGVFFGEPWRAPGHWAGVIALLWAASYVGARRAVNRQGDRRWGAVRALTRAIIGAQLALLASGAAVLTTGLVLHLDRVDTLMNTLDAGVFGGIALILLQLAIAPNAIIWSASYALGAGFTLGRGSLVAPASTDLGVLPGIPILGALPSSGPGDQVQLWWLAAGVLAGAVAACLVIGRGRNSRVDETALLGGLAGLLSGVVFTGLAWLSSGALGTVRLAEIGPRLLELLVMGGATLGLAGMVTGLILGLVSRIHRSSS